MSLRLHRKYGVNPTIPRCFYCGEDKNEIAMLGAAFHEEAPMHGLVIDKQPCEKCADQMRQGVLLIETRDGEQGDNPYRTGRQWVLKQEAVERIFTGVDFTKQRCVFIEESVAAKVGLHAPAPSAV